MRRHPRGFIPLPPTVLAPGETAKLIRARTSEEFERHVEQNRERAKRARMKRLAGLRSDPRGL